MARPVTKVPSWEKAKFDPKLMEMRREYSKQKAREHRAADPEKALEDSRRDHERLMADPERLAKKRESSKENQRKRRGAAPTYKIGMHLRHLYGIDLAHYNQMLEQQGGSCAICKKPETATRAGKALNLGVDHCHTTKRVRGLLCTNCNQGLGRFKDDPAALEQAIIYLLRKSI